MIRFPRYLASTIRCDRHPVKLENAEFSSVADDQKESLLLSVVVPVYKEEGNITEFLNRLKAIISEQTPSEAAPQTSKVQG